MSAICSAGVPPSKLGRQRMAEGVHAMTAFLAHRHVRYPGVLDQDLMQMVLIGERPDRRQVPHEHLRAVAGRPAMADVVDHRPADLFQQRQLHPVTGLGLRHQQPVARPVEIGELQPPATVPYVRTVDTARSAARSDAWNRATASAPSPDSLLTDREYRRSTAPCAAYSPSIWATLNK